MSGHLREQRRHGQHLDVVPGGGRVDHVDRLGAVRRAGHVGDHSPGPHRGQRAVQQPALQLDQRRDVVRRPPPAHLRPAAQRAQPGARRVEQHPVERARPPTAAAVPSATSTSTSASPAQRAGAPARRGAARGRRRSAARPSGRTAASSPVLPPGPAHMSSQAASGPSSGARASSSAASWLPSSCTAAAPERTDGSRPGSPPGSRTANGDHGPGSPPDSSASVVAVDPPGDQVHLGRGVVGQQRRPPARSSPPSASRQASTIHRGWSVASASRCVARRRASAASHCVAVTAGGDLAQHGVDQPGGAGADDRRGSGRRWCRPRRATAPAGR